ncbi:hypothetical protein EIN_490760, partial [Entamoeba invadens IP1]
VFYVSPKTLEITRIVLDDLKSIAPEIIANFKTKSLEKIKTITEKTQTLTENVNQIIEEKKEENPGFLANVSSGIFGFFQTLLPNLEDVDQEEENIKMNQQKKSEEERAKKEKASKKEALDAEVQQTNIVLVIGDEKKKHIVMSVRFGVDSVQKIEFKILEFSILLGKDKMVEVNNTQQSQICVTTNRDGIYDIQIKGKVTVTVNTKSVDKEKDGVISIFEALGDIIKTVEDVLIATKSDTTNSKETTDETLHTGTKNTQSKTAIRAIVGFENIEVNFVGNNKSVKVILSYEEFKNTPFVQLSLNERMGVTVKCERFVIEINKNKTVLRNLEYISQGIGSPKVEGKLGRLFTKKNGIVMNNCFDEMPSVSAAFPTLKIEEIANIESVLSYAENASVGYVDSIVSEIEVEDINTMISVSSTFASVIERIIELVLPHKEHSKKKEPVDFVATEKTSQEVDEVFRCDEIDCKEFCTKLASANEKSRVTKSSLQIGVGKVDITLRMLRESLRFVLTNYSYLSASGVLGSTLSVSSHTINKVDVSVSFKQNDYDKIEYFRTNDPLVILEKMCLFDVSNKCSDEEFTNELDKDLFINFMRLLKPRNIEKSRFYHIEHVDIYLSYSLEEIDFVKKVFKAMTCTSSQQTEHFTSSESDQEQDIQSVTSVDPTRSFFMLNKLNITIQPLQHIHIPNTTDLVVQVNDLFGHMNQMLSGNEKHLLCQFRMNCSFFGLLVDTQVNVKYGKKSEMKIPLFSLFGKIPVEKVQKIITSLSTFLVLAFPYKSQDKPLPEKVEMSWKEWFGSSQVKKVRVDNTIKYDTLDAMVAANQNNLRVIDETYMLLGRSFSRGVPETQFYSTKPEDVTIIDPHDTATPFYEQREMPIPHNPSDTTFTIAVESFSMDCHVVEGEKDVVTLLLEYTPIKVVLNKGGITLDIVFGKFSFSCGNAGDTPIMAVTLTPGVTVGMKMFSPKQIKGSSGESALEIIIANKQSTFGMSLSEEVMKVETFFSTLVGNEKSETPTFIEKLTAPPTKLNLTRFVMYPMRAKFNIKIKSLEVFNNTTQFPMYTLMISSVYGDVGEIVSSVVARAKDEAFKKMTSLLLWTAKGFVSGTKSLSIHSLKNVFVSFY